MQSRYDPPTAVTFLLAGLGMGALLARILSPRPEYGSVGSDIWVGARDREGAPSSAV
jgi:hypothetical protein